MRTKRIINFIGKSYWKRALLSTLVKAPRNRIFQKDLMYGQVSSVKLSLWIYLRDLVKMGVIRRKVENNKVIFSIDPKWKGPIKRALLVV